MNPSLGSPASRQAGPSPAGGDLDQLIRAHDWAATPLGPITDWPLSLRTAVDICVASRFPMVIFWGHEFRLLYNDAYRPVLGSKHPQSLGQPCAQAWAEIWPTVGPMLSGVLRTGAATFSEDLLLIVERAGYPEESHFTFSYSPIKGRGGGVGGVFCACSETTARVLAERRRITLHRLGMIPVSEASTAEDACRAAMLVLGDNPADVPFAMTYLLAPGGGSSTLIRSARLASDQALTEFAANAVLNDEIRQAVSTQMPRILTGLSRQHPALPTGRPGRVGDAPPDAVLLLPLTVAGAGHPASMLCCAVAELDEAKTVFFSNVSHEFRTPLTLIMAPHTAIETGGSEGQTASVAAWLEASGVDAAVWLDRRARGPLSSQDRVLFGLLSAHLGHALARAIHYEQARDVALALQQSVLGLLDLPIGFAVRYEPAMRPLEVGGDWYDVTPLDQARIGVVVGDCVGRGLDAAVVMGQLRSACRALLLRADGPAQVLGDLDTFAERIPGAHCSTVFCAIIDPATATITYSSAGHPPAILAHPDAGPELLDQATAVPLAVPASEARAEATALLRPGSALLLYTDGLVERRGERLDAGIQRAAELAQRHLQCTPDELADQVMAALTPAGGFDDDVAVLTYRQPPAQLRLNVPAEPACLAGMRRSLRYWLAASGVPSAVADQVVLAASEACSNAIEHAYAGDPTEQVRVTAQICGPCLELVVADSSTWKPSAADQGDRGHGLTMMRTFMDDVVIEPGPGGTTVRMTREMRQ